MDAAFLNLVKPMDALLLVARAFDEEGLNEPAADARGVLEDLVLTDLLVVEQKLERLALDGKKGKPVTAEEVDALQRASALLNKGLRVATDKAVADLPALRSYALLSAKPALVVVNCAERDLSRPAADALAGYGLPVSGLPAFLCDAKIEEEIQELPPADRAEFLAAMGVVEPVLSVVVREMYRELGLISFLTVGEDECRAWTIRAGTPAVKAAGAVHSDIERGFIRAEVISYDDFRTFGSEAAARKAGRYRLEGKEYVMKDVDIVHFRFNA
jgi:ribosome-binding ATPase YchF (GTP1/OBG family)